MNLSPLLDDKGMKHVKVSSIQNQTEIIEFPASIVEKYFSFGSKLILFTFNEPYYRAAMPFASKNENGRIMAFLVKMDQLAEISTCLGKCSCPIVETEDYIDACGKSVTKKC